MIYIISIIVILLCLQDKSLAKSYLISDEQGLGRTFEGIGAISGGGATSKLLRNYPVTQRNQILDFLFKPDFGASLQILKVEIGGDSQSTDGAEASHMHSEHDENYRRGYEWWLMKEAKNRNPGITLYGLPWTFPGWLGAWGEFTPYYNRTKLVTYIVNWVQGAKREHGLDIDFLGVWNERPYDIEYIAMLKEALIIAGYSHIRLVAGDAMSWKIVDDYINSTLLQKSLDIIGYHYPGAYSPRKAQDLPIPLWASEEYSAFNDLSGGGCWARVLNEGYVNGLFTAYIAWNLIASYYNDLPYSRSSLMTANQPWSGYYEVNSPIWASAHHTQFTQVGWKYLPHGFGSGNLTGNGTYVSYTNEDRNQLTIVIETLDPSNAPCFYHMPKYTVAEKQPVTFKLGGKFANITYLYKWRSKYSFDGNGSVLFKQSIKLTVVNQTLNLILFRNEVITLSTLQQGRKGSYGPPPKPANFTVPYRDDFENYKEHEEAFNLVQQAGTWEIHDSGDPKHGNVIVQMVPHPPIDTCRPQRMPHPVALIGNFNWTDVQFSIDFYIPSHNSSTGVFIGARVSRGGGWTMYSSGLFFWVYPFNNTVILGGNFTKNLIYEQSSVQLDTITWYTLGMQVQNYTVTCSIDDEIVLVKQLHSLTSVNGFLAIGTTEFQPAWFDNLNILNATIAKHPHGPFPNFEI